MRIAEWVLTAALITSSTISGVSTHNRLHGYRYATPDGIVTVTGNHPLILGGIVVISGPLMAWASWKTPDKGDRIRLLASFTVVNTLMFLLNRSTVNQRTSR